MSRAALILAAILCSCSETTFRRVHFQSTATGRVWHSAPLTEGHAASVVRWAHGDARYQLHARSEPADTCIEETP